MPGDGINREKKVTGFESHSGPRPTHPSLRRNHRCAFSHTRSLSKDQKTPKETSSNAYQQWFDESNAHPNATIFSSAEFDPPHFLQSNHSSTHSDQVYIDGNDSSEAAIRNYRSIIDDLTIENRNLKEKLRWHQNQTMNQLDKDKLFELRIHELPPGKRRELEKTLSSFIYSFSGVGNERLEPELSFSHAKPTVGTITGSAPNQSSSASTFHSQLQDFSHASANTSKNPTTVDLDSKSPEETRANSQEIDKLIIPQADNMAQHPQYPEGHMPNYASKYMTKTQKMKLVVQRLEQLYTGKTSLSPQENSKGSVTPEIPDVGQCDVKTSDKVKSRLGAREAHMKKLSPRSEDLIPPDTFSSPKECLGNPSHSSMSDENLSETSSSDQRPTRPFDLDPDRSQIPAENMQYIRHLGLSPAMLKFNDSVNHIESDGWVYLNLLTNMAQLHIINVTAEFVRTSVLKMSKNFEISSNGQMIRWKGDSKAAVISSSGSNESKSGSCISDPKVTENHLLETEVEPNIDTFFPSSGRRNNFHYIPLFNHEYRSENTTESIASQPDTELREWENPTPAPHAHNWRSKKHILLEEEPPVNDGAIIFYNRARFYVDLCGDREIAGLSFPCSSSEEDTSSSNRKELQTENLSRSESGSLLSIRPVKQPLERQTSDDEEDLSSLLKNPPATEVNSNKLPLRQYSEEEFRIPSSLQPLKASGIGGTQPADHFEIHVLTRRSTIIPTRLFKQKGPRIKRINRPISRHSLNLFQNPTDVPKSEQRAPDKLASAEDKTKPVQIVIISTKTINLPPSQLPLPPGIVSSPESDQNSETTSSLNI
ncbi:putative frequency clock protein [Blumeria hordei DH14]|uniref:Putative frequency clock protein n=1 Tax=Blumeria graminis f. sp. hordei (strain DH14) TaxID=546991 RepID=N1JI82_BLUG1|nr:putative frequency clock protein [Blumeria hordei DH14]